MARTLAEDNRAGAPRRRKQEILDVATEVFQEKGYKATSIEDIAKRVKILKGSLYYYIEKKEDLLFEIIQSVHEEALENLDHVENVQGDALQKIRLFVKQHFTFNVEHLTRVAVFFHDFRSLSEERQSLIQAERDQYNRFLRDLIVQGQGEGIVCPDLDPRSTAIMILGTLNWIYQWYRPGGPRSASQLGDDYADFIVAGLACDPATHTPGHRRQLAPMPDGG